MPETKQPLSLYEFYVIAINRLLQSRQVQNTQLQTDFKQSLRYEERLITLVILLLLGEELVPESIIRTMPHMQTQVRISTNQAIFLKALRQYYARLPDGTAIAERALAKMMSYIDASRAAEAAGKNPLLGILSVLERRVPSASFKAERSRYLAQLEQLLTHTRHVIHTNILAKYRIV